VYAVNFHDLDYDLWARMAVGQIFLETGGILHNDIFSYTPTKEWIDHEWGSGIIFWILASKFGDIGLVLLKVLLFFTTLLLITKIIKLQNPKPDRHLNIIFYFFVILAGFFGLCHTVRCQLFTFIFFTLWIYVLERVRRGENRLLWIIPATMLIWANFHGGFVSGFGLLVMYGVGEFLNKKPWKKYFLIGIPAGLITLINPWGFKYIQYILYATTMNRGGIREWLHTNLFSSWKDWYAFKIILAIGLISTAYYFIKNRPKFRDIDKVKFIILGTTLYLGLSHIKLQSFFVISTACFLYHDFYNILEDTSRVIISKIQGYSEKILKIIGLVKETFVYLFIILAGGLLMINNPIITSTPMNKYPIGSVEFIKQNKLKGNLLSEFHWGSYIAWKLYPECFIAIDGRYEELYPDSTFFEVGAFINGINFPKLNLSWDTILKKYHTDIIISSKDNDDTKKGFETVKSSKDWELVYEDKISGVFLRTDRFKRKYRMPDLNPKKIQEEKFLTNINF
jgi:hypothetical protein